MSSSDWVLVYSSGSPADVEFAKGMLAEHNIEAVSINKQDSMYGPINHNIEIGLYVKGDKVIEAKFLLTKNPNLN